MRPWTPQVWSWTRRRGAGAVGTLVPGCRLGGGGDLDGLGLSSFNSLSPLSPLSPSRIRAWLLPSPGSPNPSFSSRPLPSPRGAGAVG